VTVAFWQVFFQAAVDDVALDLMGMIEEYAEGELRLAAVREDAELDGPPRRTEIALYWYDTFDDDGRPVRRLEPANMLRVAGEEVPEQPAATLVRWEQDTQRRVWPAKRRRSA